MTNQKAPQDRYHFKPFYGSSHRWALDQIKDLSPDSRILDIGPGSGAIGAHLSSLGFKDLNAVEIDPRAREHLSTLKSYAQIESEITTYSGKKFDLILLLDVLEHMPEPEEFLQVACTYLAPQGTLLISVPNIAHWTVRLMLLFGYFNYQERGILDRTHLQFFTKKRVDECLAKISLKVVEQSVTIDPVEFVLPEYIWNNDIFRFLSKVRLVVAQTFPGLFAYQHLVRLKKPPIS